MFPFQVPVQHFTAPFESPSNHHEKGHNFDFIRVQHDTRMPVEDSFILIGNHKELKSTHGSHMQNFVLRSLKQNHEFSRQKNYFVNNQGSMEHLTAVQIERPFLYSSSSWYKTGCQKNTSQIFPNQTMFKGEAMRVQARRTDTEKDAFRYQLYLADKSPYIKLSVAGNFLQNYTFAFDNPLVKNLNNSVTFVLKLC